MVYIDPALIDDERLFPRPQRRDAPAEAARRLFDAIDVRLGARHRGSARKRTLEVLLDRPNGATLAGNVEGARTNRRALLRAAAPPWASPRSGGFSPTRLLRGFEAAYGLTPHRYQQSKRIAKARRMILAGTPLAGVPRPP